MFVRSTKTRMLEVMRKQVRNTMKDFIKYVCQPKA